MVHCLTNLLSLCQRFGELPGKFPTSQTLSRFLGAKNMSKRKKTNKITPALKVTMGALSVLGVVGGWNIIGRLEETPLPKTLSSRKSLHPTPTPLPPVPHLGRRSSHLQRPRLEIKPLPTLATSEMGAQADVPGQVAAGSFDLSAMPSAAPLPTLAPLPSIPEYVPPPPPPPPQVASKPSSNGGGGGGNTSKGS